MGQIYHIHQARLISDLNHFRKKRSVNKNLANYLSDYGITKKYFLKMKTEPGLVPQVALF